MGQFRAETKAHKCAFSPAAVSEDCLSYHLSTHPICAEFAWKTSTVAVSSIYAKSKIRIHVFCFSGQLLGHIIDNDRQVHLSNLMNFIFVMYGNLN